MEHALPTLFCISQLKSGFVLAENRRVRVLFTVGLFLDPSEILRPWAVPGNIVRHARQVDSTFSQVEV